MCMLIDKDSDKSPVRVCWFTGWIKPVFDTVEVIRLMPFGLNKGHTIGNRPVLCCVSSPPRLRSTRIILLLSAAEYCVLMGALRLQLMRRHSWLSSNIYSQASLMPSHADNLPSSRAIIICSCQYNSSTICARSPPCALPPRNRNQCLCPEL